MIPKIRVHVLLVFVAIATLTLLTVQISQTISLYNSSSNKLKNQAQTALERIAFLHEKAEDIRKFMQIANTNFSGDYRELLKEEFQNLLAVEESISIKDTAIFENNEFKPYLVIQGSSRDSISGVTAEQRVLARDVRELRDLYDRQTVNEYGDTATIAVQLDQQVMRKFFSKAKFVNEMIIQAFRENVFEEPQSRIDLKFLDSIIQQELADDGLPTNYTFEITNESGKPLVFKQTVNQYTTSMDTVGGFETRLFPSNAFDDNLHIFLKFPNQRGFILREMATNLVLNLLLLVLVIGVLFVLFRTVVEQKKLHELKSDFISNMTHEFKTPISTISLACQAMSDGDVVSGQLQEQIRPYVGMIKDENHRLEQLVERILQSSTIEKGELKLKLETIWLQELIHEVAHHARFRIEKMGGSLSVDLPTEKIELLADRFHLIHVLRNLLDNAIKYSEEYPEVKVALTKMDDSLELSVSDKGIGMKKEHLNKIFENLYRIPTGNVHNVKGFGLGLTYVKAVSDLHDWKIEVKSAPNEGSTFVLKLK